MHSKANGIYWVCFLFCPIHTALLERVPSPQLREYCDPHTALLELIDERWEMPLQQQWISCLTRNLLQDQDHRDPLGQVEISSHDRGIQAAIVWLALAGLASALKLRWPRKGGGVSISVNSGSSSHLGAPWASLGLCLEPIWVVCVPCHQNSPDQHMWQTDLNAAEETKEVVYIIWETQWHSLLRMRDGEPLLTREGSWGKRETRGQQYTAWGPLFSDWAGCEKTAGTCSLKDSELPGPIRRACLAVRLPFNHMLKIIYYLYLWQEI